MTKRVDEEVEAAVQLRSVSARDLTVEMCSPSKAPNDIAARNLSAAPPSVSASVMKVTTET